MRQETADLAIENADQLAAARHLKLQKPFDGKAKGMLLVHRRHIIEAVEIGDVLHIGLVFDELLGAAVEKANVRIDARDHLAVELEHKAQHAMGGRMLRAEIHCEVAKLSLCHVLTAWISRLASHRREADTRCPPRGRDSQRSEIPG